jgi:hypothetical protein
MNIPGTERAFVVIGENIHTTRVLLRKGKLVGDDPNGVESIRFRDGDNNRRFLHIPEDVKKTQDYEEGRVKHLKIAIQQAMQDSEDGLDYLKRQIQRQEDAESDFLDLNVDEISLKEEEQKEAMRWLVKKVGALSATLPSSKFSKPGSKQAPTTPSACCSTRPHSSGPKSSKWPSRTMHRSWSLLPASPACPPALRSASITPTR